MAGTPGACSQAFCHPELDACAVRSYRQRHVRYTLVRTTTTTTTRRFGSQEFCPLSTSDRTLAGGHVNGCTRLWSRSKAARAADPLVVATRAGQRRRCSCHCTPPLFATWWRCCTSPYGNRRQWQQGGGGPRDVRGFTKTQSTSSGEAAGALSRRCLSRRRGSGGTRGSASSWCSTPWCRKCRNSLVDKVLWCMRCQRLLCSTSHPRLPCSCASASAGVCCTRASSGLFACAS